MDFRGRALIIMVAFASSGAPVAKLGFEEFGVATTLFIRVLLATAILTPKSGINLGEFKSLLGVSVVGSLSVMTSFVGMDLVPAAIVPAMFALVPVITLAYYASQNKAELSARNVSSMGLGLLGVVGLTGFAGETSELPIAGVAILLTSVVLYAMYGFASRTAQEKHPHIGTKVMTFYFSLTLTLCVLPFAAAEVATGTAVANPQTEHYLAILFLAVISTAVYYHLYQRAIGKYSTLAATMSLYIQIPTTVLLAVLLLGEPITMTLVVSSSLMIAGAMLARDANTKARRKRRLGLRLARVR